MPSKKGIEQALTWLKSKAAEKNTLDGVNAELCINVIMDLQRQYDRLGAQFGNVKKSRADIPEDSKQLHFPEDWM